VQEACVLAETAPRKVARTFPVLELERFGILLSVVEKLINRNFQRPSQLLYRLDRWNDMAVFDSRNVTAKQASPLFDVALRKLLVLTQIKQAVPNEHDEPPTG